MTILNSVEQMKHTDLSPHKSSDTDWHILGKLQLPIGANADDGINAWLTETLKLLDLRVDFLNKILRSAQDALARIMQVESAKEFKHIHLLVFSPANHTSIGNTWGFFRIEKIESAEQNKNPPDHSIEFYLYIEGN